MESEEITMFSKSKDFNIILATDGYKLTHWKQYPPGTRTVYSYFESRGGKFDSTIFFGLQYFIQRYLSGPVVTKEKIDEAEKLANLYFGGEHFNREGWEHILKEHDGCLPVKIKAVPEGMNVPTHNVLMTIENTDPKCYWLTNYLETLLVQVWYPTTVATLSNRIRKMILGFLEETGTPAEIDFKFHDFGYRGVSSQESAGLGGAAHLVNFLGTDTIAGMELLRQHYVLQGEKDLGFSIPAAEHSTITSWGEDNEVDAFKNMLESYPKGLVAVVSDSFNIFKACDKLWGQELQNMVMEREGTLVVRPDSGDPAEVVLNVIRILGNRFGLSVNDKGYAVLDPHVRVIQGDGVDFEETKRILTTLKDNGFSADNVAFGCGGALLQKLNRDTQKFAFKCSSINVNGEERDVFKSPVTDFGKKSKRGRLRLDPITMKTEQVVNGTEPNALVTVFRDGYMTTRTSLSLVRDLAKKNY
jgi:nicotinamide phosphoribosyltransferase